MQAALSAIAQQRASRTAAHTRFAAYMTWARAASCNPRSVVTVYEWLSTKTNCQQKTLVTYRAQIANEMFAREWITETERSAMKEFDLVGRYVSAADAVRARNQRMFSDDEIRSLFYLPLQHYGPERLFVHFVLQARAGAGGDLITLSPNDFGWSNTFEGAWWFNLAGHTKPTRTNLSAAMERLDHVVVSHFPRRVNTFLVMASAGRLGDNPLGLRAAEQRKIGRGDKGVHGIKRTAVCLMSRVIYGAPNAPLIGQIMGRHLDAQNTRNQRITYADFPTIERDLMAHRVPQANTLVADTLCSIIGWDTFLSPAAREKLKAVVGVPQAETPSLPTDLETQGTRKTPHAQSHEAGTPSLPKAAVSDVIKDRYASLQYLRPRSRAKKRTEK